MIDIHSDEYFMRIALQEAKKAYDNAEVPVGAILVMNNSIIAKAYNQVELLKDSTAHAEMLAVTAAYSNLGTKYLPEATLYVTVEPCLMCAGALRWGKIGKIVYGASDEKNGANSFCSKNPFHEKANIVTGILQNECAQLMKDFFKSKR